ncbi:MAG: hypothetical protein VX346_28405 [Planctomycetota bacterium]|nr:hypothetical protein [Planctomycetota bacterium]
MSSSASPIVRWIVLGNLLTAAISARGAEAIFATLAQPGDARCLVVTADQPALMERRGAAELAQVISRDSGVQVNPLVWSSLPSRVAPQNTIILLGTPQTLPLIAQLANGPSEGLGNLPLLGADGYVVQTLVHDGQRFLVIAGNSARAVYYGAIYASEQVVLPDPAGSGAVLVAPTRLTRTPAMRERAPYLLNLSGRGPEFGLEHWKVVLDGLARESHNRIYFWWQSLYKPRDFPDRRNLDGGNDRIAMTNADVNSLARYAHTLGMEFLIGGGAFSWGGAAALIKEHPETKAVNAVGMCPSHPTAQDLQLRFSLEMLEVIHEADGIWFEPRDEHGECRCEVCQEPVDNFGSKQYGQSEMTFLKNFCKALWLKRPRAQIAWLVELSKPSKMHSEDPAYFARLKEIDDPRLRWIVVWGAWQLPGPGGNYLPAAYFSRNNIWWSKPYASSLSTIRKEIFLAAQRGFLGYAPAFEPCFGVDYHGLSIPYPTDKLPYELTSYAFREFCWDPAQTLAQFRARMRNRYCGPSGSLQLVDDLIFLRAFAIRGTWNQNTSNMLTRMAGEMVGYDGKPLSNTTVTGALEAAKAYNEADRKITYARLTRELQALRVVLARDLPLLREVENRCREFAAIGSPREMKTARMCLEFIDNTHRLLRKSGFTTVEQVDDVLASLATRANKPPGR